MEPPHSHPPNTPQTYTNHESQNFFPIATAATTSVPHHHPRGATCSALQNRRSLTPNLMCFITDSDGTVRMPLLASSCTTHNACRVPNHQSMLPVRPPICRGPMGYVSCSLTPDRKHNNGSSRMLDSPYSCVLPATRIKHMRTLARVCFGIANCEGGSGSVLRVCRLHNPQDCRLLNTENKSCAEQ